MAMEEDNHIMKSITFVPQAQQDGIIIQRWRVRVGVPVRLGRTLLDYTTPSSASASSIATLRADRSGIVTKLLRLPTDQLLPPGTPLCELEPCRHPTVMKDMCADCGEDLRVDDKPQHNASVPMIHTVPELKVCEELAQKLGKEDSDRLLKDRKLVLLVDLDQTLIHTTNDNVPPNIKDVLHFQLRGWAGSRCGRWYHMRLRPGTVSFLKSMSAQYELHICTFGARDYAHKVAQLIDPDRELFSHRILSRDECFDIHTKTPNLKALFPCGDNMVCIIDDREDVWNRATNLIQVKPYHFFEHTGDINAPPGLEKTERDIEGQGLHVEDIGKKNDDEKKEPATGESEVVNEANSKVSVEMPSLEADSAISSQDTSADSVANNTDKVDSDNISFGTDTDAKDLTDREAISIQNPDNVSLIQSDNDVSFENMDLEHELAKQIDEITSQTVQSIAEEINADYIPDSTTDMPADADEEKNNDDNKNASNDSLTVPRKDETNHTKWKQTEDGMIEVEDSDDYLLYLEDILKRIHKYFYEIYDVMEAGSVPDLKTVIPQVKSQVLAGTSLVFSGLVPNFQKLEYSRAYMVARSLGAEITQDFTSNTTHLVAAKPGTAKVHMCRRMTFDKGMPHVVTPAWLWSCAERWQHVDERLFPLRGGAGKSTRKPPAHCASPPHSPQTEMAIPPLRKRTPSGRFMDTINPLLSFSSDDIADMDREVEDMINGSDESDGEKQDEIMNKDPFDDDEDTTTDIVKNDLANISDTSDSSAESLTGEHPKGWKPENKRKRRHSNTNSIDDNEDGLENTPPKLNKKEHLIQDTESNDMFREESTLEECPSERFRRGGELPSDAPDQNESDTDGSLDATDNDDGEWNKMGAALEREFLGLDKPDE